MAEIIRIEIPVKVLDNTGQGVSKVVRSLQSIEKTATNVMDNARKSVSRFDDSIKKARESLERLADEKYQLVLEAIDLVTPVALQVDSMMRNVMGRTWIVNLGANDSVTAAVEGIRGLLKGIAKDWEVELRSNVKIAWDCGSVLDDLRSIGESFALGFADEFDFELLTGVIAEAVSGIASGGSAGLPGDDLLSWGANLITILDSDILGKIISFVNKIVEVGKESGIVGMASSIGKTAKGLILSGAGITTLGAAGAVATAATLYSGAKDLVKGNASEDKEGELAYKASGMMKFTGAGLGAIAGSLFIPIPVVGTLLGAGIGGAIGSFFGEGIKKDYEIRAEQAKYASTELQEAIKDTTMTAEEFGKLFQKAVGENLQTHFGNIKLSMEEIGDIAKKMVFGDQIESVQKFAEASAEAERTYESLQNSYSNVDKINWKVSLGVELTVEENEQYIASLEQMLENADKFITDKQYEATLSLDVLFKGDVAEEEYKFINDTYAMVNEKLDSINSEATNYISGIADNGGEIEPDIIEGYKDKTKELTDMVNGEKVGAKFDSIALKYSLENLNPESFELLMADVKSEAGVLQEQFLNAFESLDAASRMRVLLDPEYTENDHQEYNNELVEVYKTRMGEVETNVTEAPLNTVALRYASELGEIWPDLEGSYLDKLKEGMHQVKDLNLNFDDENDKERLIESLDIGGLKYEVSEAILETLKLIADAIPEDNSMPGANDEITTSEPGSGYGELYAGATSYSRDAMPGTVQGNISEEPYTGDASILLNTDLENIEEAKNTLRDSVGTEIDGVFATGFEATANVDITANYRLKNSFNPFIFSGGRSKTERENIVQSAEGRIVTGPILSWIGEDGPEAVIPLGTKRRSRGLSLWEKAGEMLGVGKYGDGGIVNDNRYSPSPFENGLNQTIGEMEKRRPWGSYEFPEGESSDEIPLQAVMFREDGETAGNTEINVDVQVSPKFEISGGNNREDIFGIIKGNMKELADEIGGELAEKLKKVFSNMPLKG